VEVQTVKDVLHQNPLNLGVGILHEPTGTIYLQPFDDVPGGHAELVQRQGLPPSECKGFAIGFSPDGAFVPVNVSHLTGQQGGPASLQMPSATFTEIQRALTAVGL
jgi:hypothetical protein